MSRRERKIVAIDCETDPFKAGRIPEPFVWGAYDGTDFTHYNDGKELIDDWKNKKVYLFAHNGGKFDFLFLMPYVKETRARIINSRVVEMKIGEAILRDSWSIIPIPLRDYIKEEIEYWKLEREHRVKHRREIMRYLESDVVNLWTLVNSYFERVGKRSTIASNALTFARKQGIDVGKTNHRFDTTFRSFYYGGRCEAFKAGEFKDVNIYDLVSAYPYAMIHEHPTGHETYEGSTIKGMSDEELQRSFIDVTCFSSGALPVRSKTGIDFPEMLGRFYVTGWEFLCGKKHGVIRHDKINAVHTFKRTINFKPYVEHWFEVKQSGKKSGNKADYIIGKIMMNSLYGKLSQNPINYCDYMIREAGSEIDFDNGWRLDKCFGDLELHARDSLYTIKQKFGTEWERCPIHYNVATGASITGFTRAHLLDAMHTIGSSNILYCDTDCLFISKSGNPMALKQDGKLGSWEWEGTASPCVIAGKKLYAANFINGPMSADPKKALKIRAKGAPEAKVTLDDMRRLIKGEKIPFAFDAPTFSIGKEAQFMVRKLSATALHKR